MGEFGRQETIEEKLEHSSIRCQLGFSAAVAERILPNARSSMERWRRHAWTTHRNALDTIWEYLEGKQLSMEKYEKIREDCEDQLPNDEDPNWPSGYGGFEAGATVAYALDVLIDSNAIDAARAASQPLNALREYLIDELFSHAKTHRDIDEAAIDNHHLYKQEIETQNRQLSILNASDSDDKEFSEAIKKIREESAVNPIELK